MLPIARASFAAAAVVVAAVLPATASAAGRWTAPVTIDATSQASDLVLGRHGAGTIAAWRDGGLQEMAVGRGGTWNVATTGSAASGPASIAGHNGRGVVTWRAGDGSIMARRLIGATWQPVEVLAAGAHVYPPIAAADSLGNVAVVWFDDPFSTTQVAATALWPYDGPGFQPKVPHATQGYWSPAAGLLAATLEAGGAVQLVFAQGGSLAGYVEPVVLRLLPNGSFTEDRVGTTRTCLGDAAASHGPLLVCWSPSGRTTERTTDPALALTHPVGGTWASSVLVPRSTLWGGFHPVLGAVATDVSGRGLAAVTKERCDATSGSCGAPTGTDLIVATGDVDGAGIGAPTTLRSLTGATAPGVLRAGYAAAGRGTVVWGTQTFQQRQDGTWQLLNKVGSFPFAAGNPTPLRDAVDALAAGDVGTGGVRAAALDQQGPAVAATFAPSPARVGQTVTATVSATDGWSAIAGPATIRWGDGTPPGTATAHVYGSPGTYHPKVTVKDAAGNSTTRKFKVVVTA